jgi:hypothetical protein
MRNPMRRVCRISAEIGAGRGSWLAVIRLGAGAHGDLEAHATQLGQMLLTLDGVLSSRLLTPDQELSSPLPNETTQGRLLDPLFLIDASSEPAAQAAAAQVAQALHLPTDAIAVLRFSWQLLEQDLPAPAAG